MTPLDLALGVAVLLIVGLTFSARGRRNQAMAFLGLGVLMSVGWLRLGSVDVAFAEAALGTGLLSGLLVWLAVASPDPAAPGTHRRAPTPSAAQNPTADGGSMPAVPRWLTVALGVFSGSVISLVAAAVWLRVEQQLPRWSSGLAEELADTEVDHQITGVLLAFRGYDTLLESAVLMFAGIAILALGQDRGLTQTFVPIPPMVSILRWFVRLAAPALLLVGLWLLFVGSSDSGGAFQSGAVLAGMLILLRTAGVDLRVFILRWLRPLLVVGVIVFILAGAVGPLLGAEWLSWDLPIGYALILLVETFLTAGITAGLYLLYLGLENPVGLVRSGSGEATR